MDFEHLYILPFLAIMIVVALSAIYWIIAGTRALRGIVGSFLLKQCQHMLRSSRLRRWAEDQTGVGVVRSDVVLRTTSNPTRP